MNLRNNKGFTLFQLVMVLIGLGMAAAVAVRFMFYSTEASRKQRTIDKMKRIVYAIHGNPEMVPQTNFGYVGDMAELPGDLTDLVERVGGGDWNGPYFDIGFDENEDDVLYDAWGQAFTYNSSSGYILSTGGGATLRQDFYITPYKLLNNSISGKVVDINYGIPTGKETGRFSITLTLRGNSGTKTSPKWSLNKVDATGSFSITGLTAGNYNLEVTYTRYSVTINKFLTIPPFGTSQSILIRFNVDFYEGK